MKWFSRSTRIHFPTFYIKRKTDRSPHSARSDAVCADYLKFRPSRTDLSF